MCNKQVESVELHHYNNETILFDKEKLWEFLAISFDFNYSSLSEFLSDYTEDDTDYIFKEIQDSAVLNMSCPMCKAGKLSQLTYLILNVNCISSDHPRPDAAE